MSNTYVCETSPRTGCVVPNDAPDPRLALRRELAATDTLPAVAAGDTATVACAVLFKHRGAWRADLAFEQFYVSDAWVQHLLEVLRGANLPVYAVLMGRDWYVDGVRVQGDPPEEVALAVSVSRAGFRDAHLISGADREPRDWRLLLDEARLNESQYRYFHTLEFLDSLHGSTEGVQHDDGVQLREGQEAA